MVEIDKEAARRKARSVDWQMPETANQKIRHIEPILDASGTLRRHVLSEMEAARANSPAKTTLKSVIGNKG
ncbi:hypothetical protein [Parvibaculum lavamentivorans]|uniref:hypothetical protein n=1 Tax=Parvibaculum lavamentivorans TaxID=256618 RepID=UPI0002EB77BE|nr:hypothetical protein [Parvibaculum lavamentivorans]